MSMNKQRIAIVAIIVGIVVFLLKILAYLLSNSVALLSDAMESIINIAASIMMLMALRVASMPEDSDHRYGHHKAENISAMIEGILIIVAAVLIVEASIGRILSPVPLTDVDMGLLVSLIATSLNGALAIVMMREARRSHSIALEGDAKHLFSDVISSVGVVIALFIATLTGLYILDAIVAIVVAVILAKMGIDVLRRTAHDLMDSTCEEEEEIIEEILDRNSGYLEYHELKTRRSGRRIFMDVHMCLNGDMTVSEGIDLVLKIEDELKDEIPGLVPNIRIEDHTHCKTYSSKKSK